MEVVIHLKVPLALAVLLDLEDHLDLVHLVVFLELEGLLVLVLHHLDLVDPLVLVLSPDLEDRPAVKDLAVLLVLKGVMVLLPVDLVVLLALKEVMVLLPVKDLVVLPAVKDLAPHPVLKDLAVLQVLKEVMVLLLNRGKNLTSNMQGPTIDKRIMYLLQMYPLKSSSYLYKLQMPSDKPMAIEMAN